MITLDEVQTLGINHRFDYLGDAFNYRKVETISFQGIAISGDSGTGLNDVWEKMGLIKGSMEDFQPILVNGFNLGSGRVISFGFPEQTDPRRLEYSVEVEIYKSGDMSNFAGPGYEDYLLTAEILPLVTGLNESFDFQKLKDGTVSFSRSISFELIETGMEYELFTLSDYKQRRVNAFNNPSFELLLSQYPTLYIQNGHRLFTESYNHLSGVYSFSETFKGPTGGETYYWTHTQSMQASSDGVTSVGESGSVIGLQIPLINSANSGIAFVESGAQARAESFYGTYGNGCDSNLTLISKSRETDVAAGTITYSLSFNDDPFSSNGFIVTRNLEIQDGGEGIVTLSESGSITSNSSQDGEIKLNNSINYFENEIEPSIKDRLFSMYSGNYSGAACGCSGTGAAISDLRLYSRQKNYQFFEGGFDYAFSYKNDCTSLYSGSFLVTFDKETKHAVPNVSSVITASNGEIAQNLKTNSLASVSNSISVLGQVSGLSIDNFLDAATFHLTPPIAGTYFSEDASYVYNPDESRLDLSFSYFYEANRAYNEINL